MTWDIIIFPLVYPFYSFSRYVSHENETLARWAIRAREYFFNKVD